LLLVADSVEEDVEPEDNDGVDGDGGNKKKRQSVVGILNRRVVTCYSNLVALVTCILVFTFIISFFATNGREGENYVPVPARRETHSTKTVASLYIL
jgi:hypothetical protein